MRLALVLTPLALLLAGCCLRKDPPAPSDGASEAPAASAEPVPSGPAAPVTTSKPSVPGPALERAELADLRACCVALRSDSATAVSPHNVWLMAAANHCNAGLGAIRSPAQQEAVVNGVRNALRGAPVPEACKKAGVRPLPPGP